MKKYILSFLTLLLSGLSSPLFAQEIEYSFDVKMQTNYDITSNSIRFTLKYPQFKEQIALKLIYDPSQQPKYNGDNWIWYHSNPIHDFSFSLSNKTFSS
jgi:hypothetical protein